MRDAGTFELPYGYAWLLRLQYELRSWNDSDAVRWAANIQPMATYMSERMITYLKGAASSPFAPACIRTPRWRWTTRSATLARSIPRSRRRFAQSADRLFKRDIRCNTAAEPGPSDFASPCLMEASIMGQLMPIATRFSRGSTHFCRRSTRRSFTRSRWDSARSS